MSVRSLIISHFKQVAQEQKKKLPELTDDLPLLNSGLDSLCLAIIVARLDDELGCDPFSAGDDSYLPSTFGDFISLYEDAVR